MGPISQLLLALTITTVLSPLCRAHPTDYDHKCRSFKGNFTVHSYQVYPENADFDFTRCVLYLGVLWNASVGIYDPYAGKMTEVLEFENISHHNEYHIGGVNVEQSTGLLSIVVDAASAFVTGGQDISGTNWIMQWNPVTHSLVYKINLTDYTHGKYGGFGDSDYDPDGNVYVIGTYSNSIMKVSKGGKSVETWWLQEPVNQTRPGMGGIATKDWILLANDQDSGNLFRFNMRAKKGVLEVIPISPPYKLSNVSDAAYLPPRYHGKVLLVAEDLKGVAVFRSKDGEWKSAEYLGEIPWTDPTIFITATVQVGDAVYMDLDPLVNGTPGGNGAGNLSDFSFWDITDRIDALLEA